MKRLLFGAIALGLSVIFLVLVVGGRGEPRSADSGVIVESLANLYGPRPSSSELTAAVRAAWPKDPEDAEAILDCESSAGTDPDTWNPTTNDGGPLQLNRATWEQVFRDEFGWTWDQVVLDPRIHLAAAKVIYVRTGGWDSWACSPN